MEDETVNLENSLGRILSAEVKALIANPPNDVSSMDGYAINTSCKIGSNTLNVVDLAAAGTPATKKVTPETAIRIFTGAKLPEGANAVVIQEEVTQLEKNRIKINSKKNVQSNDNIRKKGSDFVKGTTIKPGILISPKEVMLFAAMGHKKLVVKRQPVISIISVGNELNLPGSLCKDNQIYASNAYGISALLKKFACKPVILTIARDNILSIKRRLILAYKSSDIIVTSGGASVGTYDLVKDSAKELGLKIYFEKVNVRPGKPVFAGHLNETPLIGLPGNPVSSYVCAQLFLLPLIMEMNGCSSNMPRTSRAQLDTALTPNGPRKHFMRASLRNNRGTKIVHPKIKQDSSQVRILQESDCLIVRPPHDPAKKKKSIVTIIELF